jgi:hypothetical protein
MPAMKAQTGKPSLPITDTRSDRVDPDVAQSNRMALSRQGYQLLEEF